MSTPPVPPDGTDDLDPTGIRALLSSLPDPGPMPADLVDRINASIAAEQSARETPSVIPLRRTRRWGWQHIGAAAAAAAVIAIGVPALVTGTGPGDVLASFRGGGNAADSASGAAASAESRSEGGAAAPSAPKPGTDNRVAAAVGDVALEASGTAYTVASLASQARSRLSIAADEATTPQPQSAAKADTGAGLRACLAAIGVRGSMPLRGDVATLDGAPAVIVVVTGAAGQTVYAVSPECDGTHPMLLAGPFTLP